MLKIAGKNKETMGLMHLGLSIQNNYSEAYEAQGSKNI